MADKTWTGRTSHQGRGSNYGRGLFRDGGNVYGRGLGCIINTTKPKVQGKCESLESDVYLIVDAY